jgi:hypothetical protein
MNGCEQPCFMSVHTPTFESDQITALDRDAHKGRKAAHEGGGCGLLGVFELGRSRVACGGVMNAICPGKDTFS